MRAHFKAWAEPFLNEHPEFVIKAEDIKDKLASLNILEVGSGKGQLIYKMALHNEDITFFAMERNVTCAGFLAKKINQLPKNNCYVIAEDFEKIYDSIPKESFDILMLSFPDPWPKKRHEKRRLTSAKNLAKLSMLLKHGGYLRLKTDNDELFEFSKKTFLNEKSLKEVSILEDYKAYYPKDEMSEYEENFRKQGHLIHQIIFQRR